MCACLLNPKQMHHEKIKHTLNPVNNDSFSNSAYLKAFGWKSEDPADSLKYENTTRLAKAYEVALDIRKFEIELYWKRSTNFWLLITGISTALGLLSTSSSGSGIGQPLLSQSSKELACLILSLAATMLCTGWWLANKASKFWQQNWERQVDILEQELIGPLYKTVLSDFGNFKKRSHFSVSDINKFSSAYLWWLFLLISFYFIGAFNLVDSNSTYTFNPWKALILIFNLLFAAVFYFSVRRKTNGRANLLDLKIESITRHVEIKTSHHSAGGLENLKTHPYSATNEDSTTPKSWWGKIRTEFEKSQ